MKIEAKFITFEGGEGAGKSTQIQLLEKTLKSKGLNVITTREPGGTVGAELLRSALKEHKEVAWDSLSQTLILYAARRDLVEKVIKPSLSRNIWVLCDRFADSSLVYQGYAQNVGIEFINHLHENVLGKFHPDLTFFFDISPEEGLRRLKRRQEELKNFSHDTFDSKDLDFHKKVYEGYKLLTSIHERFVSLKAHLSVEEVAQQVLEILNQRYGLVL